MTTTFLMVDEITVTGGKPRAKCHLVRGHRLPVLHAEWLPERRRDCQPARTPGTDLVLLDVCGRPRSPATMPGARKGKKPANAGLRYPAQPLTHSEALAILARFGRHPAGVRDRALFALMWRSGLRVQCEALALLPGDLNAEEGLVHVRCGKGAKSRTVPMDPFGWEHVNPWLELRQRYPAGPVFCVVEGRTKGVRAMGAPYFRVKLKQIAAECRITKNVRPHQLRHSLACDLVREEFQLPFIQKWLGHASPATTGVYLAGLPAGELYAKAAHRPAPGATRTETPA